MHRSRHMAVRGGANKHSTERSPDEIEEEAASHGFHHLMAHDFENHIQFLRQGEGVMDQAGLLFADASRELIPRSPDRKQSTMRRISSGHTSRATTRLQQAGRSFRWVSSVPVAPAREIIISRLAPLRARRELRSRSIYASILPPPSSSASTDGSIGTRPANPTICRSEIGGRVAAWIVSGPER